MKPRGGFTLVAGKEKTVGGHPLMQQLRIAKELFLKTLAVQNQTE